MRSTESRRILNVGESENNFASQLPRTPESMPVLRIRDVELSYHDVGRGSRVVVLLHGFPFSADLWLPQIKALRPHYRTIAPDLRGFGGSDVPGAEGVHGRSAGQARPRGAQWCAEPLHVER